ncbi:MAG: isoprenylcysteine carboxylmethyltransferase family protein [Blastocatellia bacterium]
MSNRNAVSLYFVGQGAAILLWWLLLWLVPDARPYFQIGGSETALLAFWLPDLLLLGAGSLLGSYLCYRQHRFALLVLCVVCGAMSYASLYCLAFSLWTDASWLNVVFMVPAMLLSIICTLAVSPVGQNFARRAVPAPTRWNLTKTLLQIVVIWGVILFLLPALIVNIEQRAGLPRFTFSGQSLIAAGLFLGLSSLGIFSGVTMARLGEGTPLPVDGPRALVVRGPYAFVRNPMALAGLGQGIAVGLWFGSVAVLAYALAGSWVWQFLVRPLEEDDLLKQFGAAYEAYRKAVRCWWPRFSAYRG